MIVNINATYFLSTYIPESASVTLLEHFLTLMKKQVASSIIRYFVYKFRNHIQVTYVIKYLKEEFVC